MFVVGLNDFGDRDSSFQRMMRLPRLTPRCAFELEEKRIMDGSIPSMAINVRAVQPHASSKNALENARDSATECDCLHSLETQRLGHATLRTAQPILQWARDPSVGASSNSKAHRFQGSPVSIDSVETFSYLPFRAYPEVSTQGGG